MTQQYESTSCCSLVGRKLLVITDSGTKSGQRSLVEYFRRYGQVDHVKIYEGSPLLAVLQFCNAISVDNAVKLQHVIDGHIVTCFPYQVRTWKYIFRICGKFMLGLKHCFLIYRTGAW